MVAGGLMAIFFVLTLVLWTMVTMMYLIVVSHYFLTTLTDSSSGQDEVQYPRESLFDWWWKPVLCAWALFLCLPISIVVAAPLLFIHPLAGLIGWLLALWFLWPFVLASILYTQHWLHFAHLEVLLRMVRHFPALIYVHLVTFAMCAGSLWLVGLGLTDNLAMLVPAVLIVPVAILLYARHWGRFAWLSLNYLPRYGIHTAEVKPKKERRVPRPKDDVPEMEVDAAAERSEGVREGLPPGHGTGVRSGSPATKESLAAGPPPGAAKSEVDEFTYDPNPYKILDEPGLPGFGEKTPAPAPMPAASSVAPIPVDEEEDEWATEKKPYLVSDPVVPLPTSDAPPPLAEDELEEDPNKPMTMSRYYDERAKKEADAKRQAEKEKREMPRQSKKTPTFYAAMLAGVWGFTTHYGTFVAWANLAVFTFVELILLWMLVTLMPGRQ